MKEEKSSAEDGRRWREMKVDGGILVDDVACPRPLTGFHLPHTVVLPEKRNLEIC